MDEKISKSQPQRIAVQKHDLSKHCHDLRWKDYICNKETGKIGLKCKDCKYYY